MLPSVINILPASHLDSLVSIIVGFKQINLNGRIKLTEKVNIQMFHKNNMRAPIWQS